MGWIYGAVGLSATPGMAGRFTPPERMRTAGGGSGPSRWGGTPHLVVTFDDPELLAWGFLSVSRDRLYLTVSQYESNIWVANLRW